MEPNGTHHSSARRRNRHHRSRDDTIVHSVADRDIRPSLEHDISRSSMSAVQDWSYRSSTSQSTLSCTTTVNQRLYHSYSVNSVHQTSVLTSDRTVFGSAGHAFVDNLRGRNERSSHQDRDLLGIGGWAQHELSFGSGLATADFPQTHGTLIQNFNAHGYHHYYQPVSGSFSQAAVDTDMRVTNTGQQLAITDQSWHGINGVNNHLYHAENVLTSHQQHMERTSDEYDMMLIQEESAEVYCMT